MKTNLAIPRPLFCAGTFTLLLSGLTSSPLSAAERIAFSSDRSGASHIYVMDPAGTNPLQLTKGPGSYFWPSFSNDGSKIVFVGVNEKPSVRDLFLMNADGTGQVQLTDTPAIPIGQEPPFGGVGPTAPAFHPSGDRVIFASNGELFVIPARPGAEPQRISLPTSSGITVAEEPVFSPDGSQIAFAGWTETEQPPDSGIFLLNSDIYLVSTNGSNLRQLTSHSSWETTPAFSPDGSLVIFTRQDDDTSGVYLVNASGGRSLKVHGDSTRAFIAPSFSPDAAKIVFAATAANTSFEIFSINRDGSGLLNLTQNPADDLDPSWASLPNRNPSPRLNLQLNPSTFILNFVAASNQTYSVQHRADLIAANWQTLTNIPSAPHNRDIHITNTLSDPQPHRFFRVSTAP